jgi:hypothetical protein
VPICDRGFSYFGHACWRIQGTFDFFDAKKSSSSVGAHLAILKDQNHLRAVVDNLKVLESQDRLRGGENENFKFSENLKLPLSTPTEFQIC